MSRQNPPRKLSGILAKSRRALEEGLPRVPTGFPLIDEYLCEGPGCPRGLTVPSILLLGGQPGSGKSVLAQQIAFNHTLAGGHAYYQDFEMGERWFTLRGMYRHARVGQPDFRRGLSPVQQERWEAMFAEWAVAGERFWYQDEAATLSLFKTEVSRMARETDGVLMVVLDSIQKVRIDLDKRRSGIDGWCRTINEMRKKFENIVFIVVSELARSDREYAFTLGSFKESGGLEYTADDLMGMIPLSEKVATKRDLYLPSAPPGEKYQRTPTILQFLGKRSAEPGEVCMMTTVRPYYGIKLFPMNDELEPMSPEEV